MGALSGRKKTENGFERIVRRLSALVLSRRVFYAVGNVLYLHDRPPMMTINYI
jgi:hypothetical protein